jgi:hypothetical protein
MAVRYIDVEPQSACFQAGRERYDEAAFEVGVESLDLALRLCTIRRAPYASRSITTALVLSKRTYITNRLQLEILRPSAPSPIWDSRPGL